MIHEDLQLMNAPSPKPFFSILIPTYNHAKYLRQCLDSVLVQDCGDYELLICNDASTDETASILRDYPTAHIITNGTNQGCIPSSNRLLSIARGEFVYCWASDDYLTDIAFLSEAKRVLTKNPTVGCLYAGGTVYDENALVRSDIGGIGKPEVFSREQCWDMVRCNSFACCPSTLMMRRAYLLEIGGFEERLRSIADYLHFRELAVKYGAVRLNRKVVYVRRIAGGFSDADKLERRERKEEVTKRLEDMIVRMERGT